MKSQSVFLTRDLVVFDTTRLKRPIKVTAFKRIVLGSDCIDTGPRVLEVTNNYGCFIEMQSFMRAE